MSFSLHPTKNKKRQPGDPYWYRFEHYEPDPDNPRQKLRKTRVKQLDNDRQAEIYDHELKLMHAPVKGPSLTVKTLDQLVPAFLDYYQHDLLRRPRSAEAWMQGWRNLKPIFGNLRPNHVTEGLIREYKRERSKQKAGIRHNTVKPATIQKELNNLSSLLKYCVKEKLCEPFPWTIERYRKRDLTRRPVIIPTPDQVQEMFKVTTHWRPDLIDFYHLVYYTGFRSEEARLIRRRDVDLNWGIILIEGKGGKWRFMPLVGPLRPSVERLCEGKKPDDYLLISKRTGKPYSKNCGKMDKAATQAGITEHITLHVLRKCFATHCLYWDIDMRTVQVLLGHSDIKTTETYTPLPPSFLINQMKRFGIAPQEMAINQ